MVKFLQTIKATNKGFNKCQRRTWSLHWLVISTFQEAGWVVKKSECLRKINCNNLKVEQKILGHLPNVKRLATTMVLKWHIFSTRLEQQPCFLLPQFSRLLSSNLLHIPSLASTTTTPQILSNLLSSRQISVKCSHLLTIS